MTVNLLNEICLRKREHVIACKRAVPLSELEARIVPMPATRKFQAALQARRDKGRFGLIAEMKRASPSAGIIRTGFDPASIAEAYKAGGAACLSVLTDQPYFQGRDQDVAAAGQAGLPVLRKDFMIDPYQIAESRVVGADCVLLIMAALADTQAAELYAAAVCYRLDVLVEAHDAAEIDRALKLPGGMIGINNRDLRNLKTDIQTTRDLAGRIPPGRMVVSESGLRGYADLKNLESYGVGCFLIGEHLLKQPDLVTATRTMLGE